MKERILQLVLDSFRDQFYPKALDCVKTLREEALKVNHHHDIIIGKSHIHYYHNYNLCHCFFGEQTLLPCKEH